MKKIMITCLITLLSAMQVFAEDGYDFVVDGFYYKYDLNTMTATIVHPPYTEGIEYNGAITIPATVKNGRFEFEVTEIDKNTFANFNITSVTFKTSNGKGVKKIGSDAFAYCYKLERVDLPNTLTRIGERAFLNCQVLKTIKIPSGVTKIERLAFSGCKAMEGVVFPDTMEPMAIGESAFSGCGLTSVTLPKGLGATSSYAFSGCKKLTTVNIPDDFFAINTGMFENCTSLSNISFPDSLKGILRFSFDYCPLTSVTIPSGLEVLMLNAFYECQSLEEIILEDGEKPLEVGDADEYEGREYSALKKLYWGRNVIKQYERDDFTTENLTSITIGKYVTEIPYTFSENLKEVICKNRDPYSVTEKFSKKVKGTAVLKVPAGTYDKYCNAPGWKEFFNIEEMEGDGVLLLSAKNFPDANFRAALAEQLGINEGDEITDEMIAATTSLKVGSKRIADLTGIEHFTALTYLSCSFNQLTSLDVSKNTALTELYCNSNQLTALDVSNNTALTELWCDHNQLTTLDVSGCTTLTELRCHDNQLTALDVSRNTALTSLHFDNNPLILLNVSGSRIKQLFWRNGLLVSLDASGCTALTNLYCNDNQLTSLNVSGCTALTNLYCNDNQLTSLNVSGCTALTMLHCYNNQLTSLNVSGCTALTELYCGINQLTSLNVSGCTVLTMLHCYNNQLTSLNVSGCTALELLDCSYNQLSSLNVSGCPSLIALRCEYNQLILLDVSKNTALGEIDCMNNKIKNTAMDLLINNLRINGGYLFVINTKSESETNVCTKSQVAVAKAKGWRVYDYPGIHAVPHISPVEYEGSDETNSIDASLNDNGKRINENYYSIDGKKLSGEPTKKGIYIRNGRKVVK